jgi:hypothetical protein
MKNLLSDQYDNSHIDQFDQFELEEVTFDDDLFKVIEDKSILESRQIYFSGGSTKIKEVLIRREPYVSA